MSQPYPAAFRRRLLLAALTGSMLAAGLCFAETTLNGNYSVTGAWNTGDANRTRVCKVAAADPGTCTVGDCYYNTAAAAGHNWKLCTTTNVWTEIVGSGAAMGFVTASGAPGANQIAKFTSATDITGSTLSDSGTIVTSTTGSFISTAATNGWNFNVTAPPSSSIVKFQKNGASVYNVDADGHLQINPALNVANLTAAMRVTPANDTLATSEHSGLNATSWTLSLDPTASYLNQRFNFFTAPNLTASGGGALVTNAATLAVTGAPALTGGTPPTVTNNFAFWVQGGESRLAGKLGIDPGADSTAEYKIVADPDGVCNQNNVLMYTAATGGITCQPLSSTGTQCIPQVAADGSLESSTLCHLTSSGIDTFQLGGTGALSVVPGSAATILGTCGLPWPKMWVSELDATSAMLFKTSTAAECTQSTRMTLSGAATNASLTLEAATDLIMGDGKIKDTKSLVFMADSDNNGSGEEIDLDADGDATTDFAITALKINPAGNLTANIGDSTHRISQVHMSEARSGATAFKLYTNNAAAAATTRLTVSTSADQATATFSATNLDMNGGAITGATTIGASGSITAAAFAGDKLHLVSGFAAGGGATAAIDATATEELLGGDIVFGVYDNTAGGPDTLMTVDGAGDMVLLRDFSARDITASSNISGTWQGTTIAATKGGTGLSTVTTGDLLYGSAANTWSALADVATGNVLKSGGVGVAPAWGNLGALYTLTSDDTDANSTTKTDLTNAGGIGTKVLPANYFTAGKTIRVVARGRYGTALVPGNITLDFDLVSSTPTTVTVATTGSVAAPAVSLTNQYFECSLLLTCRTTGTTGTVQSQGFCSFSTAAGTSLGYEMVETGTRTINTTLTEEVKFSMTWATANASNTITVSNATVEALN